MRQQHLRPRLQRLRAQGRRLRQGRRRTPAAAPAATTKAEIKDVDELVRIVTDKVMAALAESLKRA